MYLIMTR